MDLSIKSWKKIVRRNLVLSIRLETALERLYFNGCNLNKTYQITKKWVEVMLRRKGLGIP